MGGFALFGLLVLFLQGQLLLVGVVLGVVVWCEVQHNRDDRFSSVARGSKSSCGTLVSSQAGASDTGRQVKCGRVSVFYWFSMVGMNVCSSASIVKIWLPRLYLSSIVVRYPGEYLTSAMIMLLCSVVSCCGRLGPARAAVCGRWLSLLTCF